MTESLIRLENVSRVYGQGESRVVAVSGLNLDLVGGSLTMLMGPSGSGKTTLLMLMGCLLKPTSGDIYVFGKKINTLSERHLPQVRRKYIGFVFQGFNLFPALTAIENVEAMFNIKGTRRAAARDGAAELLEKVGLKHRMRHLPADLSGGEKQRIAIARALACNPPVILADEPTGQLDSKTGRSIVEMLKRLAETEGRLVFMVSHDNRITDLADNILWMEDGVLQKKTPDRVGNQAV